MDRENDFKEFIQRCQSEFNEELKILQEKRKIIQKKSNASQSSIQSRKNYAKSENGKYSITACQIKRRKKIKDNIVELEWHEKKLIGRFYKNCPEGYEVDHIIPISKGGKHILSNLQYLSRKENRSKSDNVDWWDNSFHCENGMKEEAEKYLWDRIPCLCMIQHASPRFLITEMLYHEMINSRHEAFKTLERWYEEGKYGYGKSLDLGWKICKSNCID